jgi:hypothetical protein
MVVVAEDSERTRRPLIRFQSIPANNFDVNWIIVLTIIRL